MPLNPLAVSQAGLDVPGMNTRPYPTLGPAQGGIGPGAQESPQGGPDEQDKLSTVVRLAMASGIKDPDGLGNFLKGLGFQTAARLAKPAQPRGITDDPATGPGGAPAQPPMPPGVGATPMPPSAAM